VLKENDGIVVANRGLDQTFRIVGAGRANHFQPRSVHKPHLRILRVKRPTMDVTAAGPANDQRRRSTPTVMRLGNHVYDLIEGTADEIHELKFGHGPHAGERSAKGGAHDGRFGNRRINHTLGSEAVDETARDFESTAVDANVFANTEHGRIAFHLLPDSLSDGFEIGQLRHRVVFAGEPTKLNIYFKCTAASLEVAMPDFVTRTFGSPYFGLI